MQFRVAIEQQGKLVCGPVETMVTGSALSRSVSPSAPLPCSFAVQMPVPAMPAVQAAFAVHVVRNNQITH